MQVCPTSMGKEAGAVARPEVPHCRECEQCLLRVATGGGYHRLCGAVTAGPPAPMTAADIRHTSPDWCPRRYGSVLRLEYETIPAVLGDNRRGSP